MSNYKHLSYNLHFVSISIVDFIVPIIAIAHCIATLYLIIVVFKNKETNPIIKIDIPERM